MDYAYGAFLGLLCGDAAGAPLEFYRGKITDDVVCASMRMSGGGQLCVGKGQVTDDSELAMSLAYALHNKKPQDGFPLETVASYYSKWYLSQPFDIGSTCARAFSVKPDINGFIADRMLHVATNSYASEANGALMRVTPIALWTWNEPMMTIVHCAKMDAMLSHPSIVCQECNAVLCLAIAYLVKHPHDNAGTIAFLEDYMKYHCLSDKVKEWFNCSISIENLICTRNIGHVRWAFILAMYFLRNNTSFEEAIKITLLKGGDTDTNAAIVGAMIGALHGVNNIPNYMKSAVLSFNVEEPSSGYKRPQMYSASKVKVLTNCLFTHKIL